MKRAVILATARSPYNDYFFREIGKSVNLDVFEWKRMRGTHPWRLGDPGFRCFYVWKNLHRAIASLWRADAVLIVGWDSLLYLLFSVLFCPWRRVVLWTDTPDPVPRGIVHAVLRGLVLKYVSARFSEVWGTGQPGCEALRQMRIPEDKIVSCPFFLDPADRPGAEGPEGGVKFPPRVPGDMVGIYVGQLKASKGCNVAIKALTRVPDHVKLWIVGDGPERTVLEAQVKAARLEHRVTFFGWLQPSEVAQAMNLADLMIHPALVDPFPTVVLDVMNRGKAIIGTVTSGSVSDRVIDGWNGYKLAPNDAMAIADRLLSLGSDPEKVQRLGRNARLMAQAFPVAYGIEKISRVLRDERNTPWAEEKRALRIRYWNMVDTETASREQSA
jgi:glycosyltransferase involved in cell wall biosynthesis